MKRIIACHNKIAELPLELFLNKHIVSLDVSKNRIKLLPTFAENAERSSGTVNPTEVFWECSSLKLLKCSKNIIAELPREIHGAINLEKLYLDYNNLTEFNIVWKCPLVFLIQCLYCDFFLKIDILISYFADYNYDSSIDRAWCISQPAAAVFWHGTNRVVKDTGAIQLVMEFHQNDLF